MVKNSICLGSASKQITFFWKQVVKNTQKTNLSRIGSEQF